MGEAGPHRGRRHRPRRTAVGAPARRSALARAGARPGGGDARPSSALSCAPPTPAGARSSAGRRWARASSRSPPRASAALRDGPARGRPRGAARRDRRRCAPAASPGGASRARRSTLMRRVKARFDPAAHLQSRACSWAGSDGGVRPPAPAPSRRSSTTASTAASAWTRARPTCCGGPRPTRPAGGSCSSTTGSTPTGRCPRRWSPTSIAAWAAWRASPRARRACSYDRLIERVRPQVERHHKRTPAERALRRLLFETLPHPRRLRALAPMLAAGRRMGAEKRLPERLAALAKVAPQAPVGPRRQGAASPSSPPPWGRRAAASGCCWAACSASSIPRCTAPRSTSWPPRALRCWRPRLPDCCGALEFHGGAEAAAVRRAQETMAAFEREAGVDHVVVNAAGCGSAMKEYGELLGTAEARAFSEPRARRLRAAGLGRAARAARAGAAARRLPRRLPPRPRPGRPRRNRASCCARSRTSSWSRSAPSATCAAGRRASTTSFSPRRRRSSARARRAI